MPARSTSARPKPQRGDDCIWADHCERGSASIELAILAVAIVALGALFLALGRVGTAREAVDQAATDAARAGSLARTATAAHAAVNATTGQVLAEQQVDCPAPVVHVDASGFAVPPGQTGTVRVAVSCAVPLADLTFLPGLPGSVPVSGQFTSVVDPYRGHDS